MLSQSSGTLADNTQITDESMWKLASYALPLQLGELCLTRFKFSALKNTAHFLKVSPVDSPIPPEKFHTSDVAIAVNSSCPVNIRLRRVSVVTGCLRYVTWQYKRQYVNLQGSFSDYEKNFSSKKRATLKRKVRKFVKQSDSTEVFRVFRTPEEINAFFSDAIRVSKLTYQDRLFDQGLQDSEACREKLMRQASEGNIIGWILYIKDLPVAYTLGEVVSDHAILYGTTGYDPSYAKLSPGTVLQYFIIQSLFASGRYQIYDLCMGEAAHKRLFSNAELLCADIIFLKHTFRNWYLLIIHVSFSIINERALQLLEALGVKKFIKKAIRRWSL